MEQKLELKHIAPYLPYGIPAILSPKGIFNQDDEYPNPRTKELCIVKNISIWEPEITGQLHISDTYSFDFDEIEEICICLRPLSDLTKEIEVNGERFVPLSVLVEKFRPLSRDLSIYLFNGSICIDIETEDYSQTIDLFDGFLIIQKLIKWHFDIFGLIEKGLAIDINTLKK
jgi:hypothetical protein